VGNRSIAIAPGFFYYQPKPVPGFSTKKQWLLAPREKIVNNNPWGNLAHPKILQGQRYSAPVFQFHYWHRNPGRGCTPFEAYRSSPSQRKGLKVASTFVEKSSGIYINISYLTKSSSPPFGGFRRAS
jgi:hypothetical protein